MPAATRSIVIDVPPEKLFDVIVDYDRYPEFLPEVKEARSRERKGNAVDVDYVADVVKRIRYTLHHEEERPRTVRWSFVRGELMRDNRGSWTLEPTPDGKTRYKGLQVCEIAEGSQIQALGVGHGVTVNVPVG